MALSVHVTFLVIGAGLLSSAIIEASAQDVPDEQECTHMAVAGCYPLYDQVLWNLALRPDHDGNFNDTALLTVCSDVRKKSSCHQRIENCPGIEAIDRSRQEKGYGLFRDFICDIELFKDFQKASACLDHEKMEKCHPQPPEPLEQPPFLPSGQRCRSTNRGWICREVSLHPECIASLSRVRESHSKAHEAVALLTGCDYEPSAAPSAPPPSLAHPSVASSSLPPPTEAHPSAAPSSETPPSVPPPSLAPPSVAPLGFFLYFSTLSLLRWTYVSG